MRPVLVLAGTARVVVTISRCLQRHGIDVDVLQLPGSAKEHITSRSIRNVYRLPTPVIPDMFASHLMDLIERGGYDTLVPTTDESLAALAPLYDDVSKKLYPGCPRPDIVRSVLDKRLTLSAARECTIDVPREYLLHDLTELDAVRDDLRFPLLIKPASKAIKANTPVRLLGTIDHLREELLRDPGFGHNYLLQEYCEGFGIGVEVLIWDDEVRALFQHRRIKEFPVAGGVSILAEAQQPNPALVEASTRLLRRLRWQGVAMVEFRYNPRTDSAVLMEVNGRYWGSLALSVNAGVEFPFYEWQMAHEQEPQIFGAYAPGFRTLWRIGDLARLTSLIVRWRSGQERCATLCKESGRFLADFCSVVPDAIWSWRDPLPAMSEFYTRILKSVLSPRAIAKLLPKRLASEIRIYRDYGTRIGLRHTYLNLAYGLGIRGHNLKSALKGSKSFLFVCRGNIMRSAIAAEMFTRRASAYPEMSIASAGLFAKVGSPANPAAVIAAREIGISLDKHRSRAVTSEMLGGYDIIFVMDFVNAAVMLHRFPQAARKVFLLGEGSAQRSDARSMEITDPYGRGAEETSKCCLRIQSCVEGLGELLRNDRRATKEDLP